MLSHRRAERLVGGHPGAVERGHVQRDEAPPLRLGDLQATVHVDQVLKAELAAEAVRPAEGLSREHRQTIDVCRAAFAKERLQERVTQDAVVEGLLETVQPLLAREIPFRDIDEAVAQRRLEAAGLPAAHIPAILGFYAAYRAGWSAPSNDLARLAGRPVTPSIQAVAAALDGKGK
jgi:hypothetical protein